MTDIIYDTIKNTLAENERLFTKLVKVAQEYDAIDFDESGFYDEEVARCERHWNKLATKMADALSEALEDAEVKVLKNEAPNIRVLKLDVTSVNDNDEKETTRLSVDYGVEGQISIDRQG